MTATECNIIFGTFLYTLFEAICNGMLIFATVVMKIRYVIPWEICKLIRIMEPIAVGLWYHIAGFTLQWKILTIMLLNFVLAVVSVAIVVKAVDGWPQRVQWCCRHGIFVPVR
ncbi:uncharacterized protein [Periplaneta americana]|uniref:uncharacterized protein n=1 Tax=Periplaneta americana TaxID=6978 RepID=UPI0037E807FD